MRQLHAGDRLHPPADDPVERRGDRPEQERYGRSGRDPFDERANARPALFHAVSLRSRGAARKHNHAQKESRLNLI